MTMDTEITAHETGRRRNRVEILIALPSEEDPTILTRHTGCDTLSIQVNRIMNKDKTRENRLFPILFQLDGMKVVVVGGGRVAERKVHSLLECGAHVSVISPRLKGGLTQLAANRQITHLARAYEPGDLDGATLVFIAISDHKTSAVIAKQAKQLNIPVNVVDTPEMCSFIIPAVVRRGLLTLAVSTSGASPAWARHIKEQLAREFGEEYAHFFNALAAVRHRFLEELKDPAERRKVLMALAEDSFFELAKSMKGRALETEISDRVLRALDKDIIK